MLRKTVLALSAAIAAASMTLGGSVAGAKTASKTASSATGPIVLGNPNVETTTDSNGSQPRAWQYTASTTGSVTDIEAYDAKGRAKLTVGLYSDSSGRPGKLLATGSIRNTKANAWNDVRVGSASIAAGTNYWLVWQGTDSFRDNRNGNCTTVGGNSPIRKIGSSWSTAWTASGFCPASLYANGTTSVAPPVSAFPAPVAPSNTTAPSITGTPQQGDTLTASPGSWSGDTPISSTYKWSDGTTGQSDTLGAADVGHTLRVTVTATNDGGSATATSAAVGPVTAPTPPPAAPPAPVAPSNTTAPSITGTPQQGDTLTASPGSWSGDTPISSTYKWSDGTTGQSDTLGAADVGHTLRVTVTATNDGGSATATSAAVGPVTAPTPPPAAPIPPTNTTTPAISGTPQVGDTLTVTNGTWTGDTPITFSVKWSDGAMGASDTLTSADVGQTITATVTASNDAGSASASSVAVGPVASTSDPGAVNCAPPASQTMTNTVSHLCGFADTTNTGPPAGTTLVSVPGQITAPTAQTGSGWSYSAGTGITVQAGGVLKDVQVQGGVSIVGDGATVEDSEFDAPGGSGAGVVELRHANNATIVNNDIHGDGVAAPEGCDNGIRDVYGDSENLTAENNNIWLCGAGLNNIVNGGTIEGNYIHDFGFAQADNHLDGIQFEDGGSGVTLMQDNTILMPQGQTSPIILSNDGGGTETNRTITHNLLAGGGYCFYGSGGDAAKATGITFTDNHFSRLYYSGCGAFGTVAHWQTGGGNVMSGNVWDDTGASVQP